MPMLYRPGLVLFLWTIYSAFPRKFPGDSTRCPFL